MKKFKERWGITSGFQIVIILFIFAITGSSSLYVSKPVIKALGITKENLPSFWYWFLYILLGFIAYQILLVSYGWLFGQFSFFWNIEKKLLKRIGFKRFFKEENK